MTRVLNRCWREMLTEEFSRNGETWDDVVQANISQEDLDCVFYIGFGGTNGAPFTLWTKNRVYFPTEYDGAEGVCSVPRNPCDEITRHV